MSKTELDPVQGAFFSSLSRSNKDIKRDRAAAISEDSEQYYRRRIEDYERDLKNKKRERENRLDLSPSNAQSLMVANDFNAAKFCEGDIQLTKEIRNLSILVAIAKERYEYLFGEGTSKSVEVTAASDLVS